MIENKMGHTGAMSEEMCCSAEGSSSNLEDGTGCEGVIGEMGSGGKPSSRSSTGWCRCSCSCEVG